MTRYAIFLRGVNVGGVTVRMADLREVLGRLPLEGVATLLASGNVVCRYDGDAGALKALVEGALREAFGYQAWVVVVTAERLGELIDACPFPADSASTHTYVTLCSAPHVLDELEAAVTAADHDAQEVRLGPEATAWVAPRGGTLDTPRSVLAAANRYKQFLTDRNLRTLLRVRKALDAL
ncbi:DUF1697 domain-containing protein [Actinotalea sp. K2]|uniref:DUF1697 domain-containing protein n=1 Tax=Actinotalea sp. K2 TaxID=2939438 RepID=UPI002016DC02|nr:DUF1697 domain-containing protein [Actinotalea sp. K2]MCL3861345.1 DUF1697 domain-containing protein [Actinotalea sp. K2]